MEFERKIEEKLKKTAQMFRAVAVMGVRQSGKTTLCKSFFSGYQYYNFENIGLYQLVKSDPTAFLTKDNKGVIYDELQRLPEIFNYLQEILDNTSEKGKYVISGSSNFLLNEKITQSLAGRIGYINMYPLSYDEIPNFKNFTVWEHIFNGGFAEVWKDTSVDPVLFYQSYIQSVVEKDIRQLVNIRDINLFQNFIRLIASRVGQEFNALKWANELDIDSKTLKSWVSYLEVAGVIYLLPPYYANFGKRITKKPKLYLVDTGIICSLLDITTVNQLENHPLKGVIFENFIVSQCVKFNSYRLKPYKLFYWRSQAGVEIDLLIEKGLNLFPIEIKSGQTFQENWFRNLNLFKSYSKETSPLTIVYGGENFSFSNKNKLVNTFSLVELFD